MEWRKIKVCPESCTGRIRIATRGYIFNHYRTVRAYTKSDVLNFYFAKKKLALKAFSRNRFAKFFSAFDDHNSDFLGAIERVVWPLRDVDDLGPMYVPISDEQLQFEQIEPFLELGHFGALPFELQLLVLKFVDAKERDKLLAEVSTERQAELLYAILDPTN